MINRIGEENKFIKDNEHLVESKIPFAFYYEYDVLYLINVDVHNLKKEIITSIEEFRELDHEDKYFLTDMIIHNTDKYETWWY